MPKPPFQIPDGLQHLLPMFQAEMQRDLDTLKTLLPVGGADLADHLHAMRGKCGLFGENVLYGLLGDLDGPAASMGQVMHRIEIRVRQICGYRGPA